MKLLRKSIGVAISALAFGFTLSAQAAPVTVDLTAGAASLPGAINQGIYSWVKENPAGSGVIDPFVRIGGKGEDKGKEVVHGYNSRLETYNTDSTDQFNHEIQVGQIGFIDTAGGKVMRFYLDINQASGNKSFLSLDEVQLFISKTPNVDTTTPNLIAGNLEALGLGKLVYRMDGGDGDFDNHVLLDYDAQPVGGGGGGGSGWGDMYMDIPMQLFLNAFANDADWDTTSEQNLAYIYLYSRFGQTAENNDGYEEWTYIQGNAIVPPCTNGECVCPPPTVGIFPDCRVPPNEIPEPGTLAMLGTGLMALSRVRRRRIG